VETTKLGRTGLRVSQLCLGTMMFGAETDERTSHRLLDRFVDAGGTFIDTAEGYADGESERILGAWLHRRPRRHDLVIATKVRFGGGGGDVGPNDSGLSRTTIRHNVERSLRLLQTDHIDLYQVHMWDSSVPLEETFGTLADLVHEGTVRYVGISNYSGWQLQKAIEVCRANGWPAVASLQALYNLLDRDAEWELLPACADNGLGFLPWSPLRYGWLSGKYRRDGLHGDAVRIEPDGEDRPAGWTPSWGTYAKHRRWAVVDALVEVAEDLGRSIPQVALRWVMQRPGVTAPVIGARTLDQLDDNLGVVEWSLDDDHAARLDAITDQPWPYPYALHRDASA
jgi:aryl-alcohol dehydrogenase-like predicted oxidoreductase